MRFSTRVWGLGKLLILAGALCATFLVSFAVTMQMAISSNEVQVPDLVDRPVAEATDMLAELGLGLRIDENRRPHEVVPAGDIVQQDPRAGVEIRRERTIRVWLSSGPVTTTVPPVLGQNDRTAFSRLSQEGVEVATVSEFRSPDYPTDSVVAQDPASGTRAPQVSLLMNRGEQAATYVMPDVIGMQGERAADALRRLGFRVTIVGEHPYPGVPPGTVLRQQPSGGFQVGAFDAISLEVSAEPEPPGVVP